MSAACHANVVSAPANCRKRKFKNTVTVVGEIPRRESLRTRNPVQVVAYWKYGRIQGNAFFAKNVECPHCALNDRKVRGPVTLDGPLDLICQHCAGVFDILAEFLRCQN